MKQKNKNKSFQNKSFIKNRRRSKGKARGFKSPLGEEYLYTCVCEERRGVVYARIPTLKK